MHNKDVEYDEEIAAVKSQLNREQRSVTQFVSSIHSLVHNRCTAVLYFRAILQENVSIIRLQKELKNKTSDALLMESRCTELEKVCF